MDRLLVCAIDVPASLERAGAFCRARWATAVTVLHGQHLAAARPPCLIPVFLSEAEQRDHGDGMEEWRGKLFKSKYLPLVRPFSAVPELLRRVHYAGLKVAAASSAKKNELEVYLDIARVTKLLDVSTSSEDAEQSKPASDIVQVALKKLGLDGSDAVAIGDTPCDAQAAGKASIATIGM